MSVEASGVNEVIEKVKSALEILDSEAEIDVEENFDEAPEEEEEEEEKE